MRVLRFMVQGLGLGCKKPLLTLLVRVKAIQVHAMPPSMPSPATRLGVFWQIDCAVPAGDIK